MRFVLDNSVLAAWVLDEASDYAERRGRLTAAEVARIRELVLALPIEVVTDHVPRVLTEVLALARHHGLSVYDASTLDLAMREGLPLATLDERLAEAARRCGVPLLEP